MQRTRSRSSRLVIRPRTLSTSLSGTEGICLRTPEQSAASGRHANTTADRGSSTCGALGTIPTSPGSECWWQRPSWACGTGVPTSTSCSGPSPRGAHGRRLRRLSYATLGVLKSDPRGGQQNVSRDRRLASGPSWEAISQLNRGDPTRRDRRLFIRSGTRGSKSWDQTLSARANACRSACSRDRQEITASASRPNSR